MTLQSGYYEDNYDLDNDNINTFTYLCVKKHFLREGDTQTTHHAILKSPGIRTNDRNKGIYLVTAWDKFEN